MKQAIIVLCLLALGISGCREPENHLTTKEIGDGSLEIRYLDTFGFAPHTVRFYYRGPDGGETFLTATELHNDGANLDEGNLDILESGNGTYEVIMKGQEQADAHWLVDTTGGKVTMKKIDP